MGSRGAWDGVIVLHRATGETGSPDQEPPCPAPAGCTVVPRESRTAPTRSRDGTCGWLRTSQSVTGGPDWHIRSFRCAFPILVNPSLSVMQFGMTVLAVDVTLGCFGIEFGSRDAREPNSTDTEFLLFRTLVMKAKGGDGLGVPAHRALAASTGKQLALDPSPPLFQ